MKLLKIRKILIMIVIFFAIAMEGTFLSLEYITNSRVKPVTNKIEIPSANSRVLVFAPHNDDEVLGAGELIKKTLKNKGMVKVVLITNGDGFKEGIQLDYFKLMPNRNDYIKFGYIRQNETIKALEILGLSRKDIIFLGYPDGGISNLWNVNWDKDKSYMSLFTGRNSSIYSNSFTKGALYTGENLASDISKIIKEYKPTHIIYPSPDDHHPDHWATNAFVKYVLTTINYIPKEQWLYLVHRGDWPTPLSKDIDDNLVPPAKLINEGTKWYTLDLSTNDVKEKGKAIEAYRSQMKTLGLLLSAFERKNELFGVYPDVRLIKYLRNDEDIHPEIKNLYISDPAQDDLKLKAFRGADIIGIYSEVSTKNNLHLFVKMDSSIDRHIKYKVNMFFINNMKVRRLNIELVNGKLKVVKVSKQSITTSGGIKKDIKGNIIHIIIPLNMIGSYKHIFIGADTSFKGFPMDKTAWRMLDN